MSLFFALALGGAITFATRLSFIALFSHLDPPPILRRALRLVPAAVLSAIIFPEIMVKNGEVALSLGNARLFAGVLAAAIAWRTRNIPLTIGAGMATLWTLERMVN